MGVLIDDIGLDPKGDEFYNNLVNSISDDIEFSRSPEIKFLDLVIGFPVSGGGNEAADGWKQNALKEDSDFRKNFIESGFSPIFDLVDSIPDVNILAPISDPTAALLPLVNTVTEVLASIVDNPNEFFLTKLDDIIERKDDLLDALQKFKDSKEAIVEEGINEIAVLLNTIEPDLEIATLKTKITEKIEDIKNVLKLPEIELPEPPYFELPDFSDLLSLGLSFFNFPMPDIPDIDSEAVINLYFNFDLEIPPIGVLFVEIVKVKLQMLLELVSGIPPFLKTAIDKIKEMFAPPITFSFKGVLKAIADSVINYFFDKLNQSEKIKKLIESASTIVYVINGLVKILVMSLIVAIVGVLFGKGLIMKTTAIALGLLK